MINYIFVSFDQKFYLMVLLLSQLGFLKTIQLFLEKKQNTLGFLLYLKTIINPNSNILETSSKAKID